ncbi:NUDIX domain-containing protein [Tsukamurella sp. 8F]|uniref:NUDIX hydrolase n=1 Tax=unclassified Tsukamurella TaxID=2633480 RepID=UPI0023B8F2FD|nr:MULTISPECIES: NUDIX domain-containing protein [unclassified Tsukamurella]MDF0531722.1 NUDIX domain-containing protein [Tsukamurella sp. 8J]MDF0588968.1 NUDIX domain-containing protein [Tsukamurella sp. 8F]
MPIPEYIRTIRRKIGTDLLWLPGVAAVVVDDEGRVLLGKRSDFGHWASPAGVLEPGEQPADAILREITEETGVTARIVDLVSVRTDDVVTYPNGDVSQYLSILFLCRYVSGEARVADDESTEVAWFDAGDLPPMPPHQQERITRALGPRRDVWLP